MKKKVSKRKDLNTKNVTIKKNTREILAKEIFKPTKII